jgi:hypothetical protein
MEELLSLFFRILMFIVDITIEAFSHRTFYYIGVFPMWLITLGKYPSEPIDRMSRPKRIAYGILGLSFSFFLLMLSINFI